MFTSLQSPQSSQVIDPTDEDDPIALQFVPDRAEAIQFAVDLAWPGDLVIALGKGHEQSMCFGTEERPWSEHEALRAALRQRMGRER